MLKRIRFILITAPFVFIIVFFGYFPVKYDIVLYTDNIVGEGICETYLCPQKSFAPFYQTACYFGSELKKATLQGYHYDVTDALLEISDVSEADIIGFDVNIFGHNVNHYDISELVDPGDYEDLIVESNSDGKSMHFAFSDPDVSTTIDIALPFIPSWFWIIYFIFIVIIAVLLALLLCRIKDYLPHIYMPLLSAAGIMVALLAGCFFCDSMPYVNYTCFLLNWVILFSFALLINAVSLPFLGTVLTMIGTTIWYVVNYYVINLRGKPVMPADLKAAGTAAEVMGGYTFKPSWQMILGIIVVLIYCVIIILTWKKNRFNEKQEPAKQLRKRALTAATAIALFSISINTPAFKNLDKFAWDAVLQKDFHEEGMVLTYLKGVLNSRVEVPEGYSKEAVEEYLKEYSTSHAEGVQPTNIIMVMDEAFSDLRTVGLNEQIDVMPFIDSLDENTTEGSLSVSVFGGGTCNTEFEALTGNSLAFLGLGAYPYTENVTEPMFSLASYFRDNGYITDAFHANLPQNWNRNIVYPNLGFDIFYSINDYPEFTDETMLHTHPADKADFDFMKQISGENRGKARFLFDVTMQNHSGYETWEDLEKADSVADYGSDYYPETQIYLSLVKVSDDEIRDLVETYKDSDEPTMIVYFGDHQPGLPNYAQGEVYTNVSSYLDYYKSKFFIWTNYDTETVHDMEISANYLPWLILERGNFDLPPYIQMLKEIHEKYPIISAMGVVDSKGNQYGTIEELYDDPLIKKYRYVQYANMSDEINEEWFKTN